MGFADVGPCMPWPINLNNCHLVSGGIPDVCLSNGTPVPPAIIDSSILAASQFMYAMTGRQFGSCPIVLRPLCITQCPSECSSLGFTDSGYGFPWYPLHQADGTWVNVTCSQDNCTCVELCEIPLPYPTSSITQVKIDGVVIPASQYKVIDYNKLIRTKANGCFPRCNDISKPDSAIGTWSVSLQVGKVIPELVLLAAAEFAFQLIKRCLNQPCDLPSRIQSVSRQGVSATFLDPMEFLSEGRTGIFLVDLALSTYNPKGLYKKPYAVSPDSLNRRAIET